MNTKSLERRRKIAAMLAEPGGEAKIRKRFPYHIVKQLMRDGLLPYKVHRRWAKMPKEVVIEVLRRDGLTAARKQFDSSAVNIIARDIGILEENGSRRIWRDEWNARLGTKPDTDLAAELGVSRALVSTRRRLAGVAVHRIKPAPISKAPPRSDARKRVGQIPDDILAGSNGRELSARYDVPLHMIYGERARRSLVVRPIQQRMMLGAREERGEILGRALVAGAAAAGCSLAEIGERLGFSRERARQILERALSAFQVVLADKEGEEPIEIDKIQPGVQDEHR